MSDLFQIHCCMNVLHTSFATFSIIPVTSWICGAVTRFQEGKIVAGIIRLIFGWNIIWILDIIFMLVNRQIFRLLNV